MGALFDGATVDGISWTLIGGAPLVYLRDPSPVQALFVNNAKAVRDRDKRTV